MQAQYTNITHALTTQLKNYNKRVCVGFDAVVDLLVRPVRKITKDRQHEWFNTIQEFGKSLCDRPGHSRVIDTTTLVEKPGGNMVNFSMALGSFGVPIDCVGTFGLPDPLPDYSSMPESCTLHSVAHSGKCMALEFNDGKVMLAQMDRVNDLDYKSLSEKIGQSKLRELFGEAQLVSLVNWSEILNSTEIWTGLLRDVYADAEVDKERFVFFDLTDCTRHSDAKVREALDTITAFTAKRTTVLSLNLGEAQHMAHLVGEEPQQSVQELAKQLWKTLEIDWVVVHPNDQAIAVNHQGVTVVPGFFTPNPIVSTGGGDNFNAGLALGLLLGLSTTDTLQLGNAVAGFYVRHGYSPTKENILEFLKSGISKEVQMHENKN